MIHQTKQRRPFYPGIWGALVVLGVLGGCSQSKEPWEVVYPVSGTVKFEGKPVAGAVVTFIPQDKSLPKTVRPTAITEEDGTFEVGTYSQADGAPAGSYKVLVTHYTVTGDAENPIPGPNDLPQKYSKVEETDLQVTIEAQETELKVFDLN
jgi:hypothetical protein